MAETATQDPPITPDLSSIPATDWRSSLPDDLKADKSLESFKDIGALAKSYVETKKMVGAKTEGLFKIPGETATAEERAAFHKALGVPDAPEQYAIQRPEIALDGMWDVEAEKAFLADMHGSGAPPAVVQAALNSYGRFITKQLSAAQAEAKRVEAELRQELGPNYDPSVGRANRALQQFGGNEMVKFLADSGLGRHPLMVKTWINVANAMVEHGAMESAGDIGTSVEEAQGKINEILRDKTHPYNDPNSPQHHAALEEVRQLYRIAKPDSGMKPIVFRE